MNLYIDIEGDNDAFVENGFNVESARILRELADLLDAGAELPISLRDLNGNRVGKADLFPIN